jgi:hypothetical protein
MPASFMALNNKFRADQVASHMEHEAIKADQKISGDEIAMMRNSVAGLVPEVSAREQSWMAWSAALRWLTFCVCS